MVLTNHHFVSFLVTTQTDHRGLKVNNADVSYTNIKYGVPQGFILDPLLFDIVFVIYFCGTINTT